MPREALRLDRLAPDPPVQLAPLAQLVLRGRLAVVAAAALRDPRDLRVQQVLQDPLALPDQRDQPGLTARFQDPPDPLGRQDPRALLARIPRFQALRGRLGQQVPRAVPGHRDRRALLVQPVEQEQRGPQAQRGRPGTLDQRGQLDPAGQMGWMALTGCPVQRAQRGPQDLPGRRAPLGQRDQRARTLRFQALQARRVPPGRPVVLARLDLQVPRGRQEQMEWTALMELPV